MAPVALQPLTKYCGAKLLALPSSGQSAVGAGTLWADHPVVVMAVRRPGCQLCRAESTKLQELRPELEKLGVHLVAVLGEDLPEQVSEFKQKHWGGEVYLDQEKALFAALGGGVVRRGSLLSFLNPFAPLWKNVSASKGVTGNFVGDGLTFGGLLVVRKGGDVEYAFQETTFGDHAPQEDVLAAAKRAACKP